MKPYALITHHNRHEMVRDLVLGLVRDGVETFVLDHNSTPPLELDHPGVYLHKVEGFIGEEFNLSAIWNIGLNWVARHHARSGMRDVEYAVTVLNDDVLLPHDFCAGMAGAILSHDVDVASPGSHYEVNHGPARQLALDSRPYGYCWTVRGRSHVRPDDRFKVWYGDDDCWQQALMGRGFVLLPGWEVDHKDANGNLSRNPWWQEQAGRDRATFIDKWQRQPW